MSTSIEQLYYINNFSISIGQRLYERGKYCKPNHARAQCERTQCERALRYQ